MADLGQGTILQIGTGSTNNPWKNVAEVLDIDGPGEGMETVDATHQESSGSVEKIAGLYDAGELSFPIQWDPGDGTHAGSSSLRDHARTRNSSSFRIQWSTTGTDIDEFRAFVTEVSPSAPVSDKMQADVTLDVTGQPNTVNST